MYRISVGEAFGAGFRLIRREPRAFLVWCAAYAVYAVLGQLVYGRQVIDMYRLMGSGASVLQAKMMQTQSQMMAVQPIAMLMGLVVMAVLPSAIFRAVLFPDDRRFFYLRLSAREFWVGVAVIVMFIVYLLAFLVSMLPFVLVIGIAGALAATGAAGAVAGLVLGLVGLPVTFGAAVWIFLRFSLSPVMSFAENTFRVPESWRLTRGNIWRMFLVAFGLVALMIISEIVLLATGALALSGGAANLMQAMRSNPFSLLQNLTLPGLLIGAAVGSVFGVLIYTLGAAAWADIYRQLKPPALDETFA